MRPGLRVGKYVLGERIAQGGMAEVWAAHVEGPEGFVKPVALKFILETFSGDTDFERLFVNEARIAAQLQHANLVTIFDFDKMPGQGGEPGRYYIAMERVDGYDLRRVVQAAADAGRAFPHELSLHVAGEILKGLRYVHDRRDGNTGAPLGLIHRDVSPHNVLVGRGGEVKVSDFGIAKAMAQSLGTQSGTIRGKLSYASPEQLRAEAVDHRTDQFALGITLWEMLAGRRLFDGVDEVEIIGKVLRCEIPALGDMPAGPLPPEVEPVVRKMLSPARDDRFPSTAAALSAVLALPGYTHDGTGLSELFRGVFGDPSVVMSATVRWEATPFPSSGLPGAGSPGLGRGGAFTPLPSALFGSQHGQTPRSSPGFGGSQSTRTVAAPQGVATPGPQGRTPRPGTGQRGHASGYVSDLAFDSGLHGRRRAARDRRRAWPWVVGAMAFLAVGLGAFLLVPGKRAQNESGGRIRTPSREWRPAPPTRATDPARADNPIDNSVADQPMTVERQLKSQQATESSPSKPSVRRPAPGRAHPKSAGHGSPGRLAHGEGAHADDGTKTAPQAAGQATSSDDAPVPARGGTTTQGPPSDQGPNGAPIIKEVTKNDGDDADDETEGTENGPNKTKRKRPNRVIVK